MIAQSTGNIVSVDAFGAWNLNFQFNDQVPNEVVAIVKSSYITDLTNNPTIDGVVTSTDFTPLIGSNPNGDRMWYGSGSGTFLSNNTWVSADGGAQFSNNMEMVFNATAAPPTLEPGVIGLLISGGFVGIGVLRRRQSRR